MSEILKSKGFLFLVKDKGVEVVGYEGKLSRIEIPNKLKGINVVSIGDYAFYPKNRNEKGQSTVVLKEVILPTSLLSIGNHAFSNNELEKIELPKKLKKIGNYAFYNNFLIELQLPNSVNFVGKQAFRNNGLRKIKLSNNLDTIHDYTFAENLLEEVIFTESITKIGDYAFRENRIKTIIIPKQIEKIGLTILTYNDTLTKVTNCSKQDVLFTYGDKPTIINK